MHITLTLSLGNPFYTIVSMHVAEDKTNLCSSKIMY